MSATPMISDAKNGSTQRHLDDRGAALVAREGLADADHATSLTFLPSKAWEPEFAGQVLLIALLPENCSVSATICRQLVFMPDVPLKVSCWFGKVDRALEDRARIAVDQVAVVQALRWRGVLVNREPLVGAGSRAR